MAARANWKGVLKIGELSCSVALYTAASTAERIVFHILNRKTGHRVHREFVDAETGEAVERSDATTSTQVYGAFFRGSNGPFSFWKRALELAMSERSVDV